MSFSFFTRQLSSSMATGRNYCDSLMEEISLTLVTRAIAPRTLHLTGTEIINCTPTAHAWC
jgi:hypothetical protein